MIVYNCKYAGPAAMLKVVNEIKAGKNIATLENKSIVVDVKYVKGKFGVGLKGIFQKKDYDILEKQAREGLRKGVGQFFKKNSKKDKKPEED
jgi:hypothetical protein